LFDTYTNEYLKYTTEKMF